MEQVAEWRPCYIDYSLLKRIIKALVYARDQGDWKNVRELRDLFLQTLKEEEQVFRKFFDYKWGELRTNRDLSLKVRLQDVEESRRPEYKYFLCQVYLEANFIHNFLSLNAEGFRKIVKKFKKSLPESMEE